MPATLSCSLEADAARPLNYWWPLVIEAVRRIGFGFDNPYFFPDHRGIYLPSISQLLESGPDLDDEDAGATFQQFWAYVWGNPDAASAEFWALDDPSFMLDTYVGKHSTGQVSISIAFPAGTSSSSQPDPTLRLQDNLARVRRWLLGVRELYALCSPGTADIIWEKAGQIYPVGAIGKAIAEIERGGVQSMPVAVGSLTSFLTLNPELTVRQEPLGDGSLLSLVDPFPWPALDGWTFNSLA
jgi:hypothetical protein